MSSHSLGARRVVTRLANLRKQDYWNRNLPTLLRTPKWGTSRNLSTRTAVEAGCVTPNSNIFISEATDPYFNLTLEDWLFRHAPPAEPLLLIYRDSPCVVIGRHQNPWTEVNFPALRAAGLPFIRRRSGGGTVYHDLGNTNFSIHLPRASFDRHKTGDIVRRAVQSLGVDAQLNDRNDICVGNEKMICRLEKPHILLFMCCLYLLHPFHVSGSAYKIVNKRAYHHGTMLISTRLDTLGDVLRAPKKNIVTKGVASVRSPVCNLRHHSQSISHNHFVEAVVSEFRKEYSIDNDIHYIGDTKELRSVEYIQDGIDDLKTWEYMFGQTPEFTHHTQRTFPWAEVTAKIRSKHGVILDCALHFDNTHLSSLSAQKISLLVNELCRDQRYGFQQETEDKHCEGGLTGFAGDPGKIPTDNNREELEIMLAVTRWILEEMCY
ncbi:hypothetical protein CPB83DRAFT_814445 [Crepidotus variabilis]|uniref:Putative lipoate-protein ligase A n=1 Tax=Crepidotus variabilis TaxID=179855 RepID=A0A9P6EEE0_9AGAR|nr:hypothetical protein CPB83DRAFT_814445 [Crepidotus variabilis]